METLLLVNKQDLIDAFREVLKEVLNEKTETKSVFSVVEAVEYLNSKGYKITKSGIYRHTMNGTIQFDRFGKRKIVFNLEHLDEFIKNNLCK